MAENMGTGTPTQRVLNTALALSLLYGAFISWRYLSLRQELRVYQSGALVMLGRKISEVDSMGMEARIAELGLLNAPNDLPSQGGVSSSNWPRPHTPRKLRSRAF